MKKLYALALVLAVLPMLIPAPGHAIPAFSRKYGFNCMMCHTAYPKLNDWGQRFRDNGYQLPGRVGMEKTMFETHVPLSVRTGAAWNGWTLKLPGDANYATTSGFGMRGLDLLTGGVVHENVSVLVIYTPRLDEPFGDYAGTTPSQTGTLESANIVFSNIIPGAFNVRIGRFEPGYHQFSSKRSYYQLAPYEIYGFPGGRTGFSFEDNQIGVEATGWWRCGFKYAAGVTNGTGAAPDNNKWKDVYLSLTQTIGPGEGQSAGQRFGVFASYGKSPGPLPDTLASSPTGEGNGNDGNPYYRVGGSASLNWRTWNLSALLLWGSDDKAFNFVDPAKSYDWSGGFVELDYAGCLNNRLVASVLYNWVSPPSLTVLHALGPIVYPEDLESPKISTYSGLVRCYLGDYCALNVALHGEYSYRTFETPGFTAKEHLYTMLVDFAF